MWSTLVDLLTYLGIVIAGLFIWGALSPFEVMGWWAGWFGDRVYDAGVSPPRPPDPDEAANPTAYLVFISGVGKATGETLSFREQEFLRRLDATTPGLVVIDDTFPYSVNNLPLTGQPFFARLWKWALARKIHGPRLAGYLINMRNIWQLLISADKRYGPLYNQAVAQVYLHGLIQHGYQLDAAKPVFLMGYSGAGQLAVGPAIYLKELVQAPVFIIALGGVFSSDPSLMAADHTYLIEGDRDLVTRWGYLAPGRWRFAGMSHFNRARRQGKFTLIHVRGLGHTSRGGYLDHKAFLPDGTAYVDRTVQLVGEIIRRHTTPASMVQAVAPAPAVPETGRPVLDRTGVL
jgi:hypothetical protein